LNERERKRQTKEKMGRTCAIDVFGDGWSGEAVDPSVSKQITAPAGVEKG
jgi:hypothetical protein